MSFAPPLLVLPPHSYASSNTPEQRENHRPDGFNTREPFESPNIQDVRFKVNYMIEMFHLPHSCLLLFPASQEAKRMSLKITKTGIIIRIIAYCEI